MAERRRGMDSDRALRVGQRDVSAQSAFRYSLGFAGSITSSLSAGGGIDSSEFWQTSFCTCCSRESLVNGFLVLLLLSWLRRWWR
jgi:hypothetical protein